MMYDDVTSPTHPKQDSVGFPGGPQKSRMLPQKNLIPQV